MKLNKPLTKQEQEIFKELYLKGYSATKIFSRLGLTYSPTANTNEKEAYQQMANRRMSTYRKKLNLPKRGTGYKPAITFKQPAKPKEPEYYI